MSIPRTVAQVLKRLHPPLCLNGHELLKGQLRQAGIPFKALDNGLASCADPQAAQTLADSLRAQKIDALVRK